MENAESILTLRQTIANVGAKSAIRRSTRCTHTGLIAIKIAYMHEQITKEFGKMNICMSRFGVCIGWRKYLYECTPFGYVNLPYMSGGHMLHVWFICGTCLTDVWWELTDVWWDI